MSEHAVRGMLLDEARRLTLGERERAYGDCVATHEAIAAVWSVILRVPVTGRQVALCMVGLKIVRAGQSPGHTDNYVDGAAYMAIAGECAGAAE